MISRLFSLIVLVVFSSLVVIGQEVDLPLHHNPIQAARILKEKEFAPREASRGAGSLTLPFFDDFSRYSLPTNDPDVPQSWQRWTDTTAFINNTFPISPPTIGVATLDGLASDGTPYSDTLYFPNINDVQLDWGLADSLTSMPIDLSGYSVDDSVHVYFSFECGGRGNQPDASGILGAQGDTLALEFYTPLQAGQWSRVWFAEGGLATDTFQNVFVHVNDEIYLQDGFRFRFKNYCTLHGALDHWHLDYVIVESDVHPSAFPFDEVAMQYPNNTLLNFGYTAMPWTHYLQNPSLYMSDNLTYYQRNLSETENIPTRWSVQYNGIQQMESNPDVNGIDNGFSEIVRTVSLDNFEYSAPGDLDSASFEVCVYFNQTDAHLQNDTACFEQKFTNYYSYDDGTAERAYGLQNAGGKVAMKFASEIADSLIGAYMYFLPLQYLANDQSFILQVWNDQGGVPGSLLTSEFDNFNFSLPHYIEEGPNAFVYYSFLTPVAINQGNFYVGYIQQSDVSLNMGLDKNTTSNTTNLFFQLQGASNWISSQIQGSVMIRPVFKAGIPDWVGVNENIAMISELYPNPTNGELSFRMHADYEKYRCRILDVIGRIVHEKILINNGTMKLDVSSMESASYLLQVVSEKDQRSIVKHFIKN